MYLNPLLEIRLKHLKLNAATILPNQLNDLFWDAYARSKLFGDPNGSL